MKIEDFFRQYIEGYLLGDLENMSTLGPLKGKNYGAVGYPMMSTVLAGMELLGGLLMPNLKPFDPRKGESYFLHYWDNYFAVENPTYASLGLLFRRLARHGINHVFLAKQGILVDKGSYK